MLLAFFVIICEISEWKLFLHYFSVYLMFIYVYKLQVTSLGSLIKIFKYFLKVSYMITRALFCIDHKYIKTSNIV